MISPVDFFETAQLGVDQMDDAMKAKFEAAGWRVGDAADFLGMNDRERKLLDARVKKVMSQRSSKETRAKNGKRKTGNN